MRITRLAITLFLSLAIPLSGIASFGAVEETCHMQVSQQSTADVADHSCCEDAETAALTGNPCKAGQECGTASVFYLPASGTIVIPPVHASFVGDIPSLLSPDPTTPLRPPRA